MLDIFKELSFIEVAVHSTTHNHAETAKAWRTVKAFILTQLRSTQQDLKTPDTDIGYKQVLRGMMNAFLRAHGCKERVDCAIYPEYQQALLAITAEPKIPVQEIGIEALPAVKPESIVPSDYRKDANKKSWFHKYEISYFRNEVARAKRKCTECESTIEKNEGCLRFALLDQCTHGKFLMHEKKQLCKKCANDQILINHYINKYRPLYPERHLASYKRALANINSI